METKSIKDITKINDMNGTISYLVTLLQNNGNDDTETKTFLISITSDLCVSVKRITNLIAFVENHNVSLDRNINETDLKRIYKYMDIINQNYKESTDNNYKNYNIDNQYYDEYIKLYDKRKGI